MTIQNYNVEIIAVLTSALVSFIIWVLTNRFSIFAQATTYDYCSKRRDELLTHYDSLIDHINKEIKNLFTSAVGQVVGEDSFGHLKINRIFNSSIRFEPDFWKIFNHLNVCWKNLPAEQIEFASKSANEMIQNEGINEIITKHNEKVNNYVVRIYGRISDAINPLIIEGDKLNPAQLDDYRNQYLDFFSRFVYDFFSDGPQIKDLDSHLLSIDYLPGHGEVIKYQEKILPKDRKNLTVPNIRDSLTPLLKDVAMKSEFTTLKKDFSRIDELIGFTIRCFKQCTEDMQKEKNARNNFPNPITTCCPRYNTKKCARRFGNTEKRQT